MIAEACGWAAAGLLCAVAAVQWRVRSVGLEVVARASHELRGPLTAVRLGLELSERMGELSADRLRAIELELGRASLALDDLWSGPTAGPGGRRNRRRPGRAEPGAGDGGFSQPRPVGPRMVNVRGLLADSVEAWHAPARAGGAEIRLYWEGADVCVAGDRFRLAQATGNLIANAIEHGGGEIEVRGRGDGDSVRIEVIDDGSGLPAPVAGLAARPRRARGGRGRGLAIALAAAEVHGGRLAAAPSERGARLVLELPRAGAGALASRAHPALAANEPTRAPVPTPPSPLVLPRAPAAGPPGSSGGPVRSAAGPHGSSGGPVRSAVPPPEVDTPPPDTTTAPTNTDTAPSGVGIAPSGVGIAPPGVGIAPPGVGIKALPPACVPVPVPGRPGAVPQGFSGPGA